MPSDAPPDARSGSSILISSSVSLRRSRDVEQWRRRSWPGRPPAASPNRTRRDWPPQRRCCVRWRLVDRLRATAGSGPSAQPSRSSSRCWWRWRRRRRLPAAAVKSHEARTPRRAYGAPSALDQLALKSKSRWRTKSATGMVWVLTTPTVRFGSHRVTASFEAATTSSAAMSRSAPPVMMRGEVTSSGRSPMRMWLITAPPFWARPAMSSTIGALPSMCAAMPRRAPMVRMPVPPTPAMAMFQEVRRRAKAATGSGRSRDVGRRRRTLARLAALDRDEGRTEALETGIGPCCSSTG